MGDSQEEEVPPRGNARRGAARQQTANGRGRILCEGKLRDARVYPFGGYGATARDHVYFRHMTVKIVGKGLDSLVEGLRRQVVHYVQACHVSDFEAGGEAKYIESIKIEPPAEEGVLGKWAG